MNVRGWFIQRIPRITARWAVLALASVLALIIGAGLGILSELGSVNASAQHAKDSVTQTRHLADELKRTIARNHADRLADQAQTDREIRDVICAFVSLDARARARLLHLLPARYAAEQCRPRAVHPSLRPQSSASPVPPGTSTGTTARPSPAPGPTVTRTHTVTAGPPRPPTPRPSSPAPSSSQPPIVDTPVLLCALEHVLAIPCTP